MRENSLVQRVPSSSPLSRIVFEVVCLGLRSLTATVRIPQWGAQLCHRVENDKTGATGNCQRRYNLLIVGAGVASTLFKSVV
jgi:hypothetical protein